MANTVAAIYNAFLLPGEAILTLIGKISPQTEAIMRIESGAVIYPLLLSLVAWTVMLVIGLMIFRIVRNAFWQTSALVRTLIHAVKLSLGNFKTRLVWKYRQLFPHTSSREESVLQAQFDDIDIAVLASISHRGPGIATSAPDLAQKYKLRPAQIQHRLDKLVSHQMLRSIKGSTDGYENYRPTDSGLAFIAMCERQAAQRLNLVSASGSG